MSLAAALLASQERHALNFLVEGMAQWGRANGTAGATLGDRVARRAAESSGANQQTWGPTSKHEAERLRLTIPLCDRDRTLTAAPSGLVFTGVMCGTPVPLRSFAVPLGVYSGLAIAVSLSCRLLPYPCLSDRGLAPLVCV